MLDNDIVIVSNYHFINDFQAKARAGLERAFKVMMKYKLRFTVQVIDVQYHSILPNTTVYIKFIEIRMEYYSNISKTLLILYLFL